MEPERAEATGTRSWAQQHTRGEGACVCWRSVDLLVMNFLITTWNLMKLKWCVSLCAKSYILRAAFQIHVSYSLQRWRSSHLWQVHLFQWNLHPQSCWSHAVPVPSVILCLPSISSYVSAWPVLQRLSAAPSQLRQSGLLWRSGCGGCSERWPCSRLRKKMQSDRLWGWRRTRTHWGTHWIRSALYEKMTSRGKVRKTSKTAHFL